MSIANTKKVSEKVCRNPYIAVFSVIFLTGCAATGNNSSLLSTYDFSEKPPVEISADDYLDIGVLEFDPNIDEKKVKNGEVFPEVRKAEARYLPLRLRNALEKTHAWRNAWVVPRLAVVDVLVKAKILESNGAVLKLEVTAFDGTGRVWLKKTYKGEVSDVAYSLAKTEKPFAEVFTEIAEDLLVVRNKKEADELREIRKISELRFAEVFVKESFSGYLEKKRGRYKLLGLPADNDPIYRRVLSIKERDDFFLDVLQNYYGQFAVDISASYFDWGKNSQAELEMRSKARSSALFKGVLSTLLLVAGAAVAANRNNSPGTATVGLGAAAVGAAGLYSSVKDYGASKIHDEALKELGLALEVELQPQVVAIKDQTVTLEGTVENQYRQLHNELKKIYFSDTGYSEGT